MVPLLEMATIENEATELPMQGDGLCSRCSSMTTAEGFQTLESQDEYLHHSELELKSSAGSCSLCRIIYERVVDRLRDQDRLKFRSYAERGAVFPSWTIGFSSTHGNELIKFTMLAYRDSPAAMFIAARTLETDLLNPWVIKQVKNWINECKGQHERCHFWGKPALPSRVIDVGAYPETPTVRLHITPAGQREEYVALSYCWGGNQSLQATTETLENLQRSIEVSDLPQTIQDAIKVTRRLGFRFLWVDALCIVQNDQLDTECEIHKMDEIFKNATINISASVASAASQGFLEVKPTPWPSCNVPVCLPDGQTTAVSFAVQTHYKLDPPLHTRAWTFQEYYLSRRVLEYSGLELFWHCQTEYAKPITNTTISCFGEMWQLPDRLFRGNIQDKLSKMDPTQQHANWSHVVWWYTSRQLTNEDDRLRALAGFANVFKAAWKDKYLFGSWKRNLIAQLLWTREDGHVCSGRSDRAPTWSWASLNCAIFLNPSDRRTITAHNITPETSSSTEIQLHCKVADYNEAPREHWYRDPRFESYIDLAEDDNLVEQAHYLLLDERIKKGRKIIGALLVVQVDGPGRYRRIGKVDLMTPDNFLEDRERQAVWII